MAKTILFDRDALDKLKKGVDTVANAVKVTLGARGRTVIIDNYLMPTIISKDGVTVARNIELIDPIENVGCSLVKEVALKVLDLVGDSTTTACVLAQAIFSEGMKLVAAGVNPMELKRGIDKAVEDVVEQLERQAIPVNDLMIEQVATVSANNDESIGKLVAEAYGKIGKEGIISIEDAHGTQTEVKVVDGMRLDQGFLDPWYINNPKLNSEYKNALILICDRTVSTARDLANIMQQAQGKPVLLICNDLDGEAYATARTNRVPAQNRGQIPFCAIKAPSYGNHRSELLEDIAILTGGYVISEQSGKTIDGLTFADFGRLNSFTVTKEHTTLVGGGGDGDAIRKRAMELRTYAANNETKVHDRKRLEERAAKLTGGIAVLYVGGVSQVEINEKKDRCDDARQATKAALEEGVVAGGGIALLRCQQALTILKINWIRRLVAWLFGWLYISRKQSFEYGTNLIYSVLETPLRQMCKNAAVNDNRVINKVKYHEYGYNVATEQYEDLVQSGIIDPVKVVRVALQQAASVAGTMLTSSCMMVEIPEKR